MAHSAVTTPEELLRAMLLECQVWRGIVANPNATYTQLVAALDAATLPEGDAGDAIVYGAFAEVPDDPKFKQRPRANIRQMEDDTWTRSSTSGFTFAGSLFLAIDLEIPPDYQTDLSAAYLDARQKFLDLDLELMRLVRGSGRLDFTGSTPRAVGLADPKDWGGDQFQILEWTFSYEGSV